jgi:hypothetical protein
MTTRERQILFSDAMVRAILNSSKTQTRRVLKQATGPSLSVDMSDDEPGVAELSWLWGDGPGYDVNETIKRVACPYGRPGDRLWVRETWMPDPPRDGTWPHVAFDGCKPRDMSLIPEGYRKAEHCLYRADGHAGLHGWTPAIHMFRWASRITLEVTDVRIERLQDISEADVLAEGIQRWPLGFRVDVSGAPVHECRTFAVAQDAYRWLWEEINGPGSWDANPWVWVVEFEQVKTKGSAP